MVGIHLVAIDFAGDLLRTESICPIIRREADPLHGRNLSGISFDTGKISSLGEIPLISLKKQVFYRILLRRSLKVRNRKRKGVEGSSKAPGKKLLLEQIFKGQYARGSIVLKLELIDAADHSFALLSSDDGRLDLESSPEHRSYHCDRNISGGSDILCAAYDPSLSKRTERDRHEIEMIRIRMIPASDHLSHDDAFFRSEGQALNDP